MGFCNCSMLCYALRYVHSGFAIILMGKREMVALLSLSSWCLALQFVIVVFPDHTPLLFFTVASSGTTKTYYNRGFYC